MSLYVCHSEGCAQARASPTWLIVGRTLCILTWNELLWVEIQAGSRVFAFPYHVYQVEKCLAKLSDGGKWNKDVCESCPCTNATRKEVFKHERRWPGSMVGRTFCVLTLLGVFHILPWSQPLRGLRGATGCAGLCGPRSAGGHDWWPRVWLRGRFIFEHRRAVRGEF